MQAGAGDDADGLMLHQPRSGISREQEKDDAFGRDEFNWVLPDAKTINEDCSGREEIFGQTVT